MTQLSGSSSSGQSSEALEAALRLAVGRRGERDSLLSRRDGALVALAMRAGELETAAATLSSEERDVEKLESLSATKIWAVLRGNADLELEREQAERDKARYAYADAQARHDQIKAEVDALVAQLAGYAQVDAEYDAALAAKEQWLGAQDLPEGARILEIAELTGAASAEDRELAEAEEAGRVAHGLLIQAQERLGSARSWSTWDTFGGGGLLTDMAKYGHIDEANELLRRCDMALKALHRELADVGLDSVAGVELSGVDRAFDMWFDNIFSDWSVRERITRASDRVEGALDVVASVGEALVARRHDVRQRLETLASEREALLAGPG